MNYTIKRLSAENIKDLIPLFKAVFNKQLKPEYLNKKYDTAYLGVQYLAHFAYDEKNQPVAYYGTIPFRIHYADKQVLAAQTVDVMTLPDHAGRGLYTRLGKATDALLQANGIEFVFGWPNQNAYPGVIKKLNWLHKENMHRYTIPITTVPLEKVSSLSGRLNQLYSWWQQRCLQQFTDASGDFNSSFVTEGFGGVVRDKAFFRYKSFNGNQLIRINNYQLWIKVHGGLLIGDMELPKPDDFLPLIGALKKIAVLLGVTNITFQLSEGTKLDQLFHRHFTAQASWATMYKNYNCRLPIEKLKFTYGDLDTF